VSPLGFDTDLSMLQARARARIGAAFRDHAANANGDALSATVSDDAVSSSTWLDMTTREHAQRGGGESGTNLGHEVLARRAASNRIIAPGRHASSFARCPGCRKSEFYGTNLKCRRRIPLSGAPHPVFLKRFQIFPAQRRGRVPASGRA
jgi:hypothetical protein